MSQAGPAIRPDLICIRKARWVVAWGAHLGQHYFRNDIDVVFDGNRLVQNPDCAVRAVS
jgi:hypothetical protein